MSRAYLGKVGSQESLQHHKPADSRYDNSCGDFAIYHKATIPGPLTDRRSSSEKYQP